MKKSISELIDSLSVTNIKIFHLVDKVQKNEHTREEAKKLQDLNTYRSQVMNALNVEFNVKGEIIKV